MGGRELSEDRELHVRGFVFQILEEDQEKAVWNLRTECVNQAASELGPLESQS